jgi:RHS repeat-associated protein
MNRNGCREWLMVLATVIISVNGLAQVLTGTPPFQSFGGGPDVINLGNLNVHYSMPIFSRAGRGIPFSYALAYDSSVWINGGTSWLPSVSWGLTRDVAAQVGLATVFVASHPCRDLDTGQWTTYNTYAYSNYTDWGGTIHPIGVTVRGDPNGNCAIQGNAPQTKTASDGSGITMTAWDPSSGQPTTISLPDGRTFTPQLSTGGNGGPTSDTNGNQITSTTANSVTSFYDTLSTTTPALTIDYTNPASVSYKYSSPSNPAAAVVVTYVPYTVQTYFQCSGIGEYGPMPNISLVDRITLADGSYYQFTYETTPLPGGSTNVTGRLASLRLPTGGTISYAYQGGDTGKGVMCVDGSTAGFDRTTPDGTWQYRRTGTSPSYTTTITSPLDPVTGLNNVTVINFQGTFETQRQVYQGSATGTPLTTVTTCYNGNGVSNPSSCPTTPVSSPFSQVTKFTQLNGGSQARTDAFHDTTYGMLTEKDDYDFGASTPTNKTTIKYGGTYNSSNDTCGTLGNNILGLTCKVTVTDGAGNLKSKTTYGYDETAVQSSGVTTNHTTITGSRGNTTSITSYVTSTATLVRQFKNYDTGLVYQSQDMNGQWTTYTYGACAGAFATSVSMPLSLSKSATWNCAGGVETSSTDENGQVSYVNYTTDPYFWRPESTKDQLLNITNLSYASLTQSRGHLDFNGATPASTVDVTSTLDSLGRPTYSQRKQGPSSSNYDTVQQSYDSFGRPFQSTIPYVASTTSNPTPPPSTPVITTYYDAVGRAIQAIDAGGGKVNTTYNQNDVYQELAPAPTVPPAPSSENTKRKQLEYDALGRLKSVCEVTSEATYSGTCNQSNPKTGYLTNYVYDLAPNYNSVQVTQNAQKGTAQTRIYLYDMVGRLISETNPETANLAYTYTYDSDATCGTSQGDLVKRTDAKSNVTCYAYDVLHRVVSVTYPSGPNSANTAKKYFVYDAATVNGQTMTNAKSRLAEAYTCTTCPGTKITDLGYKYSARGEVTDVYESTLHSGGYYHLTATYFAHGALNSLTGIPSMPTIYYGGNSDTSGLDGEGRYLKVTASSGTSPVTGVAYTNTGTTQPIGSLSQVTLGSADNDTFSYDLNTGRLTLYKFNIGATPQTVQGDLTWNANGTLAKLAINDPFNATNTQTCTFGYDDLARISSANCGAAWSQAFSLDPFGNASKSGSLIFQPGFDQTKNWFLPVTGFDNDGNLVSDTVHTYSWDAENKLTAVDAMNLTFDALGRMVEQARGSSYTQIVYAPVGYKLALMNGQTLQKAFCPLPGGATAVYNSTGVIGYYRHSDWLGSSRFASTPSRTKYFDVAYAPYGEDYADSGTTDLNFTGQNQDTATGLYDFMFREYSPSASRWIQPDPAGMSAVSMANPQSWNRYSYVINMPLSGTDPLGLIGPCNDACPYNRAMARTAGFYDRFEFFSLFLREWNGERWQRVEWLGLLGAPDGSEVSGQDSPANNGKPACKNNKTYRVPQQSQNSALMNLGWTVSSVTLNSNGDLTGFQIANLMPLNFQGLQLPGNSRMTVQAAPGGFTVDVSGTPGYLGLPTASWYSAGVNYVQFSNGQFTNVNGQAATIPGSSLLGSLLGINSQIQNTLNNTESATSGASSLSGALANCTF